MSTESRQALPTLLPQRHKQMELFLCDITDAVLKDDMASMEHPIFTVSHHVDKEPKFYRNGNTTLEVYPSDKGLPTIFDKDILIFAISHMIAEANAGKELQPYLVINAIDVLKFTNRGVSGKDYEMLSNALVRLQGSQLKTNIKTGDNVYETIFSLLDVAHIDRNEKTGRINKVHIKLSDFLFNAVNSHQVLTLHPDYFRLRKPVERRIYEIARKHCGNQLSWKISIEKLYLKTGSKSTLRHFKYQLKAMAKTNHMPDYLMKLDENKNISFVNRKKLEEKEKARLTVGKIVHLDPETMHDAKGVLKGWDVYYVEQEWRLWMSDGGMETPKNPDKAFLGFCHRWVEKRGRA